MAKGQYKKKNPRETVNIGYKRLIQIKQKHNTISGADPGFQVRGGGRTLKNCAEQREARKLLGYFV
jgi:hypothetical protein